MLNLRAWLIALLLVLLALGAYVVWVRRTRATYTARSLSAAQRPAQVDAAHATRMLHVDGCDKDFVVKVGELVEPRVVPGAALEQFRAVYGHETRTDSSGMATWDRDPFLLTEALSSTGSPAAYIHLSVKQGHVVQTLDDMELGIDSFGVILRKLRDRQIEVHERIAQADGGWTLTVSFYSSCGKKFRSEYTRTIPKSDEVDRLIAPRSAATGSNGSPLTSLPRSDVFMNKVVTDYSLVPSGGTDDSGVGQPSEHD